MVCLWKDSSLVCFVCGGAHLQLVTERTGAVEDSFTLVSPRNGEAALETSKCLEADFCAGFCAPCHAGPAAVQCFSPSGYCAEPG